MIEKYDYSIFCWWCGDIANSKEHKYKKSDVRRMFGKQFSKEIIIIRDGREIPIQGPDSKELKFSNPNLCQKCNSERSQKFDLAWDKAIEYILNRNNLEFLNANLDFTKIFGLNYISRKQDFLRYIIKHISCKLAINKFKVPESFIKFLNKETEILEGVGIHSFYRTDIQALNKLGEIAGIGEYSYLNLPPFMYNVTTEGDCMYSYSGLTVGIIEFRYLVNSNITNENYPGLNEYYNYQYLPISKIWGPIEIFKNSIEILNVENAPRLSLEEYVKYSQDLNFYLWFKTHWPSYG